MHQTITRKYLVTQLPAIAHLTPRHNERYYLYLGPASVIRIQSKNDAYELEKKVDVDDRVREENVIQPEFAILYSV
jgi:hypothetical protein